MEESKAPCTFEGRQIIGDTLERIVTPVLRDFADEHELYLDTPGSRPARRGKKVSWIDGFGNKHDLDFVLERGGSSTLVDAPVAFIEAAWRRYARHSRNKAQEIQGAVSPLVSAYSRSAPFSGAILAGVFTDGAMKQLESLGFKLIYLPYETLTEAYKEVGVDVFYEEDTPVTVLNSKVAAMKSLTAGEVDKVGAKLLSLNNQSVLDFLEQLRRTVTRWIKSVTVLPLHGVAASLDSIEDAINFVDGYADGESTDPLVKYEVAIRYNNGDKIEAQFRDKSSTIEFIQPYSPTTMTPA